MIRSFGLFRQNLFLIFLGLLGLYFFFAALQGDAGLFRFLQVNAQVKAAQAELDILTAEREPLANQTKRLSDHYLDLDLLDEQARKRLGMVRAGEIIIR